LPAAPNGTFTYVPTSCAGLDSRWNYQWSQLRIVRGATRGVHGENFFGCLTLATIASWMLLIVWSMQFFMNIAMSCRVCSCEVAEEKKKPDQSMIIAQRRSRLATPIGTPGGFITPGSASGRHTPMYGRQGMEQPGMMRGPPSRDMGRPYDMAPPYRETPPSEEKKPLPSDDEGPEVHMAPPPMKSLPGKQVYRREPSDSQLI
jgi:hypothetical protein